ncbi:hypothetical protein [Microbacterium allomyrinae]|jgi:hypothetical protein|uniref:Uncharacterized protein n=1 Tax=Microbacterium allomyrinae TaxID=2830666 RepID=A0A9X1LVC7_9MICO|nr:hypothetical protein [Microbacterium allomyrinae]MCC2032857.1 hypothetical protein [Microbacterium allomyrinae]
MNRTVNVVRMQLINKQTFVWVPLIVLGASFAMSIAIYAILHSSGLPGPFYGGGSQAPLWVLLFVGISSLTLTFPFSQAMSVTRREFFFGTMLAAAMCAVLLAAVFAIGGLVEEATNGWGINGYFFALDWVVSAGALGAAFFYFVMAMLIFMVGFWSATVYKRFGATLLTVTWVGIGVILLAAIWGITSLDAWVGVITALVEQGPVGFAAWGLLVTVALGGVSYLTLRRAIP